VSAPGIIVPPNTSPAGLVAGTTRAIVLYDVRETNDSATVLFSSANFTNNASGGTRPTATAKPYGDKGFIVFRKGGVGSILQARQTGTTFTNIIGPFSGAAY